MKTIPLKLNENDLEALKNEIIVDKITFVTSQELISKLLNRATYPIKNRNIAIYNILSFLSFIDLCLSSSNKTILPIPTGTFIKYFNRDQYHKYTELLVELEILVKVPYEDGKYYEFKKDEKGGRCQQYRVFNNYLNDDISLVIFDEDIDLKLETDNKYNKKMEKTILKTQIYYKEAIIDEIKNYKATTTLFNQTETMNKLRCRISMILLLTHKRYISKGDKVDRVYNSFTNLSKIARKHLHIKGVKFNNIDIKNCQPLILCYYILSNGYVIDETYLKVCELGKFYETLMDKDILEQIGDDEDLYNEYRNDIKVESYKNIFFFLNKEADITKKFANEYPNIYYFMCDYYDSFPEKTMASNLQNIEASIFNTIVPTNSNYYYTLFDAIYFTDIEDAPLISNSIKNEFGKIGINPSLSLN